MVYNCEIIISLLVTFITPQPSGMEGQCLPGRGGQPGVRVGGGPGGRAAKLAEPVSL